jgi:zinc transporter ZupT
MKLTLNGKLTSICSGVHMSKSTDLTLLICVPIPRWIPEHRMHRKTPLFSSVRDSHQSRRRKSHIFHEAHRGSDGIRAWARAGLNILTVALAVCANFILGLLHEFPEGACVALSGGPVLSRHGDGGGRVKRSAVQSRERAWQAAATHAQTNGKI